MIVIKKNFIAMRNITNRMIISISDIVYINVLSVNLLTQRFIDIRPYGLWNTYANVY